VIRRFGFLALAIIALAACGGPDEEVRDDRPVCEVRFAAPSGFEPLDAFEETTYPDHIGVRLGFRDEDRREFHVLVGIPGEIGEGLPSAGELELSEGRTARFLGEDDVWIVVWEEDDRCDPRAVVGNGFTRESFQEALADAGLA
jgi:hypothetical protein